MTTFSFDEVLAASQNYFNGDDLAAKVFITKYALTDKQGNIYEKTPTDMHHRLAKEFARIEARYPNPLSEEQIFAHLDQFKYIVPQGSPMAGIGNPYQITSISNCFVIDSPADSYGGIFKFDQEEAQIMKRRGGVGGDISTIRPRGLYTNNAAKTTDGIAVFMERFSNTCREVAQGGRRGALMLSISVHHPEIETFINIKRDLKKVTGANISIRLSDEFMNAVKNKTDVELRWPVDSKNPSMKMNVDANHIWNQINESAHASAEPGILFWDTIKKWSPADAYPEFQTVSTNPCGEITLSPYDSCRLLLVNTVSFVANPFTPQAKFDYKKYGEVVNMSQRLMDDMIELELENIDKILAKIDADPEAPDVKLSEIELWNKIKTACIRGRRTGLGVTSIGDTVAAMNTVYGSEGSVELIEEVYKHLAINSYRSSITLAKERGAFPAYDYELEKDHPFINRIMNEDAEMKADWAKYGRRNIANTTTAPAGSVSVLTQTTSGIEPAFMLAYKRRKKITAADNSVKVDYVDNMGDKWQEFNVYHHWFKTWMDITGKTDPKESPYWGGCSNDIVWVNKTKAQAVAQKWICHSISNTTNVPADTSVDVIKSIYMTGWESGCKGITVYRDGSRAGVLVSQETKKTDDRKAFTEHSAPKRPKELICDIHTMSVHGEKWTFFVGMLEGRPYEIMGGLSKFVNIPKRVKSGKILKHNGPSNPIARYDLHYDFEKGPEDEAVIKDITSLFENAVHSAFTRVTSLSLRHGTPVQFVVEQIQKGSEVEDDLFSFSKALSRVLKPYIKDGTKVSADKKCPTCGAPDLVYQEGCMLCRNCSYSKCG
jgi:ribonucleoside-diphosphate reductase alpha chain